MPENQKKLFTGQYPCIKLPVLQQLGLLGVVLLLIFSAAFTQLFVSSEEENQVVNQTIATSATKGDTATAISGIFNDITITGRSAYVWDVRNQQTLFKKNESTQLPLASLTKLMTALVAHELLEEDDLITINETAARQDSSSGLTAGETFDRMSLNDLALMSSANDGAYALAYAAGAVLSRNDPANAFVQAMNIRAKEIGLTNTFYKNPTGLDISVTEGGAYGTAKDMTRLMEYIIENEPTILELTKESQTNVFNTSGGQHETENTNYFVEEIPGLIGSKTGYTDLAGGNLIVAFEAGLDRPFIVVVLGSTRQERFNDVIALVDEVRAYLNQ